MARNIYSLLHIHGPLLEPAGPRLDLLPRGESSLVKNINYLKTLRVTHKIQEID